MDLATFENLETINAQLDVCIDEEDYSGIEQKLSCQVAASAMLLACFDGSTACTYAASALGAWSNLLGQAYDTSANPVVTAENVDLSGVADRVARAWSILLWSKLLRAKIQQKGTDCYFSRLDDVVAMLENHLPQSPVAQVSRVTDQENSNGRSDQQEQGLLTARLVVIYLLELSAASEALEPLGFAERAMRIMRRFEPGSLAGAGSEIDDSIRACYELWARYNKGLSLLHNRRFEEALSEFDLIIHAHRSSRAGAEPKNAQRAGEFAKVSGRLLGENLVYLPAILLRAETLLKLQLPYHALRTLEEPKLENTKHSAARKKLIEAEAYLQMDRLDDMKKRVKEVYDALPDRHCDCDIDVPPYDLAEGQGFPNVRGRLAGLLIDYAMARLKTADLDEDTLTSSSDCLARLVAQHHEMARSAAANRDGFFEQLAGCLGWLADRHSAHGGLHAQRLGVARRLYQPYREAILRGTESAEDVEAENGEGGDECGFCSPTRQIRLERLGAGNYEEFTKGMKTLYQEARTIHKEDPTVVDFESDETRFIKTLARVQKEARDDLRIAHLDLHYRLSELLSPDMSLARCDDCSSGPGNVGFCCAFRGLLACADGSNARTPTPMGRSALATGTLPRRHYEQVMAAWMTHFGNQLRVRTLHGPGRNAGTVHLVGLQRWNSSSPAQGQSVGGGYFLYRTDLNGRIDLGVAIDPGFDFVRNLLRMGFSLSDIDVVLVSHAHVDHCRDLESIIVLLGELSNRGHRDRRVHVVLTRATYRRIQYLVDSSFHREFIEPIIIDLDRDINRRYFEELPTEELAFTFVHVPAKECGEDCAECRLRSCYTPVLSDTTTTAGNVSAPTTLRVLPTRAYHDDHSSHSDSFGFKIVVARDEGEKPIVVGYTGDTRYVPKSLSDGDGVQVAEVGNQYRDCDVLLAHLGSIIDTSDPPQFDKYKRDGTGCRKLIRKKNHPYLPGMLKLLSDFHTGRAPDSMPRPLVLLSEFGEELRGGIRSDLITRLRNAYAGGLDFLPVDVGVDVLLWEGPDRSKSNKHDGARTEPPKSFKVRCSICDEYVWVEDTGFEHYGVDEGLFCVCSVCQRGKPQNVLQDRLRHLYDVGRELRPAF